MSTVSKYSQDNRFARIDFDEFPNEEKLLLVSLKGTEGLSELFSFRVEAIAPIEEDFDPETLLGGRASITLGIGSNGAPGQPRTILGVIRSIRELREDERFAWYELEFVPPAWISSQNRHFRIFQSMNLATILETLLGENSHASGLSALIRNYCVQYSESDLDCATRLIEEAGYYFYFPQENLLGRRPGALCVRDDSTTAPQLNGQQPIAYLPVRGQTHPEQHVWSYTAVRSLTASSVDVVNRAFQSPTTDFSQAALLHGKPDSVSNELTVRTKQIETLSIREFPSGHVKYFDSIAPGGGAEDLGKFESNVKDTMATFAQARAGELALAAVRFEGASNSTRLVPGYPFELTGHRRASGHYLVTHVAHSLRMNPFTSSTDVAEAYENSFIAIPRSAPFRSPRRTLQPRITGHQTAVVVGADGSTTSDVGHIFTDKFGRVRVQFLWCENDFNSCWIRVAHSWAGKRWGGQFIPRVGQEVVVGFENGDPDCPLIYGSVYNGENLPPHDPKEFGNVSGIMSCTLGSTIKDHPLDFTGLAINDARDHEVLHLRSARTLVQDAGANIVIAAPNAIDAYAGWSSVTLVGGLLGFKIPFGSYVNFMSTTIDATTHSGSWHPIAMERPMLAPFVVDANFGSQMNVRFSNESTFCSAVYYSYGSCIATIMNKLPGIPDWARTVDNLSGLSVGKVEQVTGHRSATSSFYDHSVAAQHIFVSGKLPTATKIADAADAVCKLMEVSLQSLPGVCTLEHGSASRAVVDKLNTAMSFAGNIAANLHIAEAGLEKIAICKRIVETCDNVYVASRDADSQAMTVQSFMDMANCLPNSILEVNGLLAAATENPVSDGGQQSDTFSFSERNHLIEAGKLFYVAASQALFDVGRFLSECDDGFLVRVGQEPIQIVRIAADTESFTVLAGDTITGGRLAVKTDSIEAKCGAGMFSMKADSIELSIGASKLTMNADGVKISAPVVEVESAAMVTIKAPAVGISS